MEQQDIPCLTQEETQKKLKIQEYVEWTKKLTDSVDSQNMARYVGRMLGLTSEAHKKFLQGTHKPMNMPPEFPTLLDEQKEFFIDRCKGLLGIYRKDPTAEHGAALYNLYWYSNIYLFADKEDVILDAYMGIRDGDRDSGDYELTEDCRLLFGRVCAEHGVSQKDFYDNIEGGNYDLIYDYLVTKKGSLGLRQAYQKAFEERSHDSHMTEERLQVLWEAEQFRADIGLTWDELLDINGMPNSEIVCNNLEEYLRCGKHTIELREAMRTITPNAHYKSCELGKTVSMWEVLAEQTQTLDFPDESETIETLWSKRSGVVAYICELFPGAEFESDLTSVHFVTERGGTKRGMNAFYVNENGDMVNVVAINPRDGEVRLNLTSMHELAHVMHQQLVQLAGQRQYVSEDAYKQLSPAISESFAQLIDDQVEKETIERVISNKIKDGGLLSAFIERRQAVFGLVQQEIRLKMEALRVSGKQELTSENAAVIQTDMEKRIVELYKLGVPLQVPYAAIMTNLSIYDPFDGLIYRVAEANDPKAGLQSENTSVASDSDPIVSLVDAFASRFGKQWLRNVDARTLFLGGLVESGKLGNEADLCRWVAGSDIAEVRSRLRSWGIALPDV